MNPILDAKYTDVMVDVETTGLRPDRHAMIQLSMIPFNLETGEIGVDYCFDRCLRVPASRSWQEGTRNWWYSRNSETLNEITARMEPAQQVMQLFSEYCKHYVAPGARFWMKRPFDWAWVESYCNDYEIRNFFHYQDVIEMTSFMKGMAWPDEETEGLHLPDFSNLIPDLQGEGGFQAHNALFDCLTQVNKVIAISKYYGVIDGEK